MSEKKFKVGDKVRRIGCDWLYEGYPTKLGEIFTVKTCTIGGCITVEEVADKEWYSDDADMFELVEETSLGQGLLKGLKEAVAHENDEIKLRTSEGVKYDSNKAPMDLIPYESLEEIAKVLGAGEIKYSAGNWAKGLEMRRLLAASLRHIGQFNSGQDYDEETQTLHLANAACNLIFAIWMYKNRPDLDNRWVKELEKKDESN